MAQQVHINGRAVIEFGAAASAGVGAVAVGHTETGVTIDFTQHTEDVYTDFHGDAPAIPFTVLNKGEEALISCIMIYYDNVELEKTFTRFFNDAGALVETLGITPNTGSLAAPGNTDYGAPMYVFGSVNATDRTHTFTIKKTTTNGFVEPELPYTFNRVYLVGTHSVTIGTRVTRHVCAWRAVPDDSGVLYTRTDPA